MVNKNNVSITNIIEKFIEGDYKLSVVQKILREVKEQEEKMRFISKYDSSNDKALETDVEINSFILSKEKKINLFEIDKIHLFIFIINDASVGKTDEFKYIEFCQNKILAWDNCEYFITFFNKKASLIKKISFNKINTFINISN